ncbi:MAG: hypothetical protein ACUVWK_04090 [Nitrososphaerales archaeon]
MNEKEAGRAECISHGSLGYKPSIETEAQVVFNYASMLKGIQRGWKEDRVE